MKIPVSEHSIWTAQLPKSHGSTTMSPLKHLKQILMLERVTLLFWINSPGGDCIAASQIYTDAHGLQRQSHCKNRWYCGVGSKRYLNGGKLRC